MYTDGMDYTVIISNKKLPNIIYMYSFHIHTVHLDNITVFFITYFGAVTPSSGSALLVLAKVTVVKIFLTTVTSASTNNPLPDDGVTAPKHVGVVLM